MNLHCPLKEVLRGRLVLEVVSSAGDLLGGRQLYYAASQIRDSMALWKVEVIGERVTPSAETRLVVEALHKDDGSPEMQSRWELVRALLREDKASRAFAVQVCESTCAPRASSMSREGNSSSYPDIPF